jgi:hypothetical protein
MGRIFVTVNKQVKEVHIALAFAFAFVWSRMHHTLGYESKGCIFLYLLIDEEM